MSDDDDETVYSTFCNMQHMAGMYVAHVNAHKAAFKVSTFKLWRPHVTVHVFSLFSGSTQ